MNNPNTLQWFPMRITYNRELKIKEYLDKLNIENFLPMKYDYKESSTGRTRVLVPSIHNLIFVHSTQSTLTKLKMTKAEFEPLRYIMKQPRSGEGRGEILVVPDRQMENFMRVASIKDDSVMPLEYNDFIAKKGKRVRIIDGMFSGVEGTIKRIKKQKHVVVQIEGLAAIAITFVPPSFLEIINDNPEMTLKG
jgi:hypothetical protein